MSTAPARPSGLPVAVLLRSFRVIPQAMGLLREAVPKNEGFPNVLTDRRGIHASPENSCYSACRLILM